jgi:hypothetical protein
MSSVGDLEHETPVTSSARGADERAQSACDAALTADHLADVLRGDVKAEDHDVALVDALDADGGRIVDEPARNPGQELVHAMPAIRCPRP